MTGQSEFCGIVADAQGKDWCGNFIPIVFNTRHGPRETGGKIGPQGGPGDPRGPLGGSTRTPDTATSFGPLQKLGARKFLTSVCMCF